jgi:Flp pilus assembly protein TadG
MGNQGRRGERGQSLVLYALLILVLFAFVAFAVDIGRAYALGNNLTETSDAAALAGARYLNQNPPTCNEITNAVNTAVATLKDNGYPSEPTWSYTCTAPPSGTNWSLTVPVALTNGQTATLYFHDPSGNNYLQVTLPAVMNYTFARVLGFTSLTVTRSGTAVNQGTGSPPQQVQGSSPTTNSCPSQGAAPQGLGINTYNKLYNMWKNNPQQPVYFALEPSAGGNNPNSAQVTWGSGTGSGNWYRLDLSGDGTNGYNTNLTDGYSGTVKDGDTRQALPGNGGGNAGSDCKQRLSDSQSGSACGNSNSQYLTLPIVEYNGMMMNGSNATYTVDGFCYAKIVGGNYGSGNNYGTNPLGCSNCTVLQFEGYFPATDGAVSGSGGTGPTRRHVTLVNP